MKNEFEDLLSQYCNTQYTGEFHLKLFNREITCLDKFEKIIPIILKENPAKENVDSREFIPIGICSEFIRKIRENNFFGEIDIKVTTGEIREIRIRKVFKLDDINKFLSDSR